MDQTLNDVAVTDNPELEVQDLTDNTLSALEASKQSFATVAEDYLKNLRELHTKMLTDPEVGPQQKLMSSTVLTNIRMVEDANYVVTLAKQYGVTPNQAAPFSQADVNKFRSKCRVCRVGKLQVEETVKAVNALDPVRRKKIAVYLGTIIRLFGPMERGQVQAHFFFLQFTMMCIRSFAPFGFTPVQAQNLYDEFIAR